MLAHYFDIIRSIFFLVSAMLFVVTHPVQARQTGEPELTLETLSQPPKNPQLPLGTLLDNNGQPIHIPNQRQSALEYSTPTVSLTETQKSQTNAPSKKLKVKSSIASNSSPAEHRLLMIQTVAGLISECNNSKH